MSNLLNTAQAAHYLGLSRATLEHWRMVRKRPSWITLGPRLIRYRKIDLDRWLEKNVTENERPISPQARPVSRSTARLNDSTWEGGQS